MKIDLAKKIQIRLLYVITWVVAALLAPLLVVQPALAQNGLVVKLYVCPQGQAAVMADSLRNEYGVIPGVRVAADERTSRVIVQAPPEVQSRISQRLAAAFPDLQPASEKATADPVEVRQISLKRIQADQLEAALWSTLGNRLTACSAGILPKNTPEQRFSGKMPTLQTALRGYRLALSGPGVVTIWIDLNTRQVKIEGSAAAIDAAARLISVLDSPQDAAGRNVRLMPLNSAQLASVQRAASLIRTASGVPAAALPLAALLMQPRPDTPAADGNAAIRLPPVPAANPEVSAVPSARPGEKPAEFGGLSRIVNPVQMEVINGLDVLVLRGNAQDVEQMMEVVRQIERLSEETEPAIEITSMKHIECYVLAALVKALYDEVYMARQGAVSITPLVVPNAILIVGRPENVKTVKELAARLDQPTVPGAQFQLFHLRYAAAATAQITIQNFFVERGGLSPAIRVTADLRSNALIVQAGPRDMAEAAELIRRIDVSDSAAVNEVRIIRLEHSLAQDIATIMQTAIGNSPGGNQGSQQGGQGGQQFGQGGQQFGQGGQQFGQGQNAPGSAGGNRGQNEQRAAMLRFLTVDAKGRKLLNSGILTDVRITADVRANALVISSPPENLDLLEGLVRQLDNLPAAEAQIKVFTVVNGDATNLSDMLKTLFTGQSSTSGQQGIFPMLQTTAGGSENSLVPLRFGVDTRTNSVIASGTMADLHIVEAILTKLDDGEVRHRKSVVIRLKNSPATDVATTINQFLTTERQILQQAGPGLTSAFEQIEREVVVVAEPVTNSLVLSATPRFFEEVRGIIDQLDARPPMVMIQVLIASIELGKTNEFGIEIGLQDSVLFDRSILSNLQTTSTTLPNGTTTQTVISANGTPGFNFNSGDPLGNSASGSKISSNSVGGQGISNFAVGRTNSRLGYGGLVLSAASENVSAMLRALAENHRVEILQRPQIMTLDNQPAFIQVGQRVPRITAVSNNALTGNTNSITLDNVGLILGVTPRISPDGLVVMQIDSEKSDLQSDATGIPIFTSPTGQVIRSPIINATTAQTTVAAMSEQTIVIGGLITKSQTKTHRSVPVLGDIPLLGNLFRYDGTNEERTELLIIMTPHIVKSQADAEAIKRVEAAKMSWCLCDVTCLYGEAGLRRRTDEWTDGEVPVIYPDAGPQPAGSPPTGSEVVPAPNGQPVGRLKPLHGNPAAPRAAEPGAPPLIEPIETDPSVWIRRSSAPQQARYETETPALTPGVQPANYQPQQWQQGNTAQSAGYQAPVTDQPAHSGPVPSFNYQQPTPPKL